MKSVGRGRRHKRVTKKIKGKKEQPRLTVFRSKKNIYAQLIDDSAQKVMTGFSTLSKEFKSKNIKSADVKAAREIGKGIADKAINLGIKAVSFDRGGYQYHGRVKSLAEGAREGGLKF
ncbi:MAG: 50S ribosomal protein L18 [Candidatus Omnitrophota bacterium]